MSQQHRMLHSSNGSANGCSAKPPERMWSLGFVAFLVTQFLVALNDNIFRWLIVPIGKEFVGQDLALTAGAVCFLLPFLVLAAPAGYVADRFSKRSVMIACKVAEIVIMILGVAVILSGNIWWMLVVLFLMGAQSAIFSPSKYGAIPEMVPSGCIAAANGVVAMTTMIACIIGVAIGGWLYPLTTVPSVLVVHPEAAVRQRLREPIYQLGYRYKEAESLNEAIHAVRGGAPKLVLLGDRIPDADLQECLRQLRSVAGGVQVLVMTELAGQMPPAGSIGREPPSKAGVGASKQLANATALPSEKLLIARDRPIDVHRLAEAVHTLAGRSSLGADAARLLPGQYRWWILGTVLVGVALVGLLASLLISPLRAANLSTPVPWNMMGHTIGNLRALFAERPLLLAALGSTYFWALGALTQLNIDKLVRPELVSDQQYVGYTLAILVLGIGIGSLLAGSLSRGRVELGLVPFGAAGIVVTSILVSTIPKGTGSPWSSAYLLASIWLFAMGCTAGLYDIPLVAFLQQESPIRSRGRLLAAYNFLSFAGMLAVSALFHVLAEVLELSARQIFFLIGLTTIPVLLAILYTIPVPFLKIVVRGLVALLYRLRVKGLENVPRSGGALLAPNHVTWIDWILLSAACPRPIRFLAVADYVQGPIIGPLARQFGVITIVPGTRSVVRSVRAVREAIRRGELVCVFPEGGLSRSGQILPFFPGLLAMVKGTEAPIIPVHLGGLFGSIFSFDRGRFFWKWPRRIPYPVHIAFGKPIHGASSAQQIRQVVQEMGAEVMPQPNGPNTIPPRKMLRMCRRALRRVKMDDSSGNRLTGSELLIRSLILRRLLHRVLDPDETNVGVLLPPSTAGAVVNVALALDRRVAVNLSYAASSQIVNVCIAKARLKRVLTSRRVMKRLDLQLDAQVVYLEDLVPQVTRTDKLLAACQTWLLPAWLLERVLGLTRLKADDLLTIIFTSGSTGDPKGVMLTHRNVGSNVLALDQILRLRAEDVMIGILPFFHSFGYTVTLWAALMLDPKVVYHHNPLEARQVGALCKQHRGTILLSPPTFLRSYIRRCESDDFATLEVIITGAEKMPKEVADAFEARFGVRPYEGYGTTELSPVVSANIPPSRIVSEFQRVCREGSVGLPLPGIAVKVVDLETGETLGPNQSGMLLVKGPNVMKGYLDDPQRTAEVLHDGWYTTGDVAKLDEEGFIYITGRVSRFSKIGGEMVPHEFVERAICEALDLSIEDRPRLVVVGIPDARKGERLVVAHTGLELPPEEIARRLTSQGLPTLWIPSPDSFCQVDEIPITGSGKVALSEVKEKVRRLLGAEE